MKSKIKIINIICVYIFKINFFFLVKKKLECINLFKFYKVNNNFATYPIMTEKETLIDMPDNSDMKAEAMKEAKWAVDNIKV